MKRFIGYISVFLVASLFGKDVILTGLEGFQNNMAGQSSVSRPDESQP